MRIILVGIILVLYFIITLPFFLIFLLIRCFNKKLSTKLSIYFVKYGFKLILLSTGTKNKVIGLENIPKDEPVLFTSNHRSFFDIVMSYAVIPASHNTVFISKKEVKKVPFLSWWMILVNSLFMDRDDTRQSLEVIIQAINVIKKDKFSVFICPEGTRNKEESYFDMLPFKEGSFKIATKSGCAIIPVAISNSSAIFEDHMPWIKPVRTAIHFGKPIYAKDYSREELAHIGANVQKIVQSMLEEDRQYIENKSK